MGKVLFYEVKELDKKKTFLDFLIKTVSYLLVAAVASGATFFLFGRTAGQTKLEQLEELIHARFVGEADPTAMEDGAAAGMLASLGDQWSYYIPAADYAAHMEQMRNAYVGIGVTVENKNPEQGITVVHMEPGGGAAEAGVGIGDIITEVEGQSVAQIGLDEARNLIRGEENTTVEITVLRGEETLTLTVQRKLIQVTVAEGFMLENGIGIVRINNFDERCAQETRAAVEELLEKGADSLIFDVRFNPGGYQTELVDILDYLLPEGILFRSQTYAGIEEVDESDADCLDVPMAVLINGNSYSAAEFFAAALDEYDKAVLVGQPTTGKSYFQSTFRLNDGSAVALSVGKYFTPNGVSLAEVGGLQPEILVEVDEETAAKIYAGMVPLAEDPQIQAAVAALKAAD